MKEIRTLYTWLEIPEDASREEIKRAYRRKARETHPDRGGTSEEFAKTSRAYDVLMDDKKRAQYDHKVRVVRLRAKVDSFAKDAWSKVQDFWTEESHEFDEQVRENRKNSEHANYFAEQDRLEREWQENFSSLMENFQKKEMIDSKNLQTILQSTDDLLSVISKSGKIHFSNRSIKQNPIEFRVSDPSISLSDQARDLVSDLRDTVTKAEKLVHIFNKLTGSER